MADIASLSLEVKSDQVKQSTAALREQTAAASASERAAQKWSTSQSAAARSSEEFSKRVRRTIADLQFQREQLARTSTEQARFEALKRAGVSAMSQEGQAITAGVRALQAQQAAYDRTAQRAELFRKVKLGVTVAVAAVSAALTAFAKDAFNAAASLDETAEQIGITARTLQALQFAGAQSGVEVEQLGGALTKFSQKMGEAAEGSKPMVEALKQLGVKNLDVRGQLRPTEDLLIDVAKAIVAIEDPARRSAAAVDFFGKSGTKLLPLLAQIAEGTEVMAVNAEKAGAVISTQTAKNLDDFADRLDRAKLIAKAWAAELISDTINASRAFAEFDDKVTADVGGAFQDLAAKVDQFLGPIGDKIGQTGASAAAMFVEAFSQLPQALGTIFTNAWAMAKNSTMKGIDSITGWLNENLPATGPLSWLRPDKTNFGAANPDPGAGPAFDTGAIAAAGQRAAEEMARQQKAARDAASRARVNAQGGPADMIGGIDTLAGGGGALGPRTTGGGFSQVKESGGAAENAEKQYAKLIMTLTEAASAQDKMTEASLRGEVAFEQFKVKTEATQKAIDIFGRKLDENDPKLVKLEQLMLRISQGKAAEAFNVATTELQKQNVILEAQIRLMGEAPEIQAREIALIKSKQEAEKAGTAITQEAIDARRVAIEQNERLKTQQEEIKRAQDLWTAPLKSALEDIQSTAADAFAEILESGNISFESLGQTFKKIITRMAAEFLALATIRPVMSVLVNAISPSMAQQMGLSTSGGVATGSGGGTTGGLGSMNIGGGGGLSNMFGGTSVGNWLSSPIDSGWGSLAAGQFGPVAPGLGGLTWGGALGGIAGLGMGAFQLASGGGSLGSTVGGIGSMLGGGVALLGPMLGLGAAAGPIGMGIGLIASLLPSLFGGSKPEPPTNRTAGQLRFGSGGFFTSGGAWGPDANASTAQGPLNAITGSIESVFDLLGGVKDAAQVWGMNLETISKVGEGWDFNSSSTFLVDPSGNAVPWRMNMDDMMSTGAAQVAVRSVLGGAVGDISADMRSALEAIKTEMDLTIDKVAEVVSGVLALEEVFETFGRDVSEAETAIKQVNSTFDDLRSTAEELNVTTESLYKIEAERQRQLAKLGNDFAYSINQAILGFTDPAQAALNDLAKQQAVALANNAAYLKDVAGYADQALNIERLYLMQRAEILGQSLKEELSLVNDLVKQLTPGGSLANVDPRSTLAGLRATAAASYGQAIADPRNSEIVQRAAADAQAFIETSLRYNAGNSQYERDRQTILAQQVAIQQGAIAQTMGMVSDPEMKDLLRKLLATADSPVTPERNARFDQLINLMVKFFADEAA